jgi:surface antigen
MRTPLKPLPVLALLALPLLALTGCGSGAHTSSNLAAASRHPGITCAPFARELSGMPLYGDAATWWDAAAGRYDRANHPAVGSVLVFRRSGRLPSGHVAVVSRLITPRQILVIQANWVPEELDEDQLVVDVSERNDWTQVRVWWPPIDQMGAYAYGTYGFILPPRPATHEELVRAAKPAAVYAIDSHGRAPPRARFVGG